MVSGSSTFSLLAQDSGVITFDDVEYYSSWPYSLTIWIGLLVVVLLITWLLSRHSIGAFNSKGKKTLVILRVVIVAFVSIMLLGWSKQEHATDLPDLIVIVDNSRSMTIGDLISEDLPDNKTAIDRWTAAKLWLSGSESGPSILEEWQQRYRLRLYLASDKLESLSIPSDSLSVVLNSSQPDGESTQLGKCLASALRNHRGRPVAGVVIISDGVTTLGPSLSSVAERARQRNIPLYVLAAGADSRVKNIAISDALMSDSSFVGDHISIRYSLRAEHCEGEEIIINVKDRDTDEVLASANHTVGNEVEFKDQISFIPTNTGDNELMLEVVPLDAESTTDDNFYPLSVSVRDDPIKVLLVDSEPRFEFRAVSDLLQRARHPGTNDQPVFQITHVLQSSDQQGSDEDLYRTVFPSSREDLYEFDVVILGDADPQWLGKSSMEILETFVTERGGGVILCAGQRFMPHEFADTPLATLVPFDIDSAVRLPVNDDFAESQSISLTDLGNSASQLQLAETQSRTQKIWSEMPGLYWWLEVETVKPGVQSLVHIDQGGSDQSVISQSFIGAGRVLFHFTDETWRWRGHEGGETVFNRYWIQSIRELCRSQLLGKTRAAELTADRMESLFGTQVQLRLHYLAAESVPASNKVLVSLLRDNGIKRTVTLERLLNSPEVFVASVGQLSVGHWSARVVSPVFSEGAPECRFTVVAPDGEMSKTNLDELDLATAAEITRGRYYRWQERKELDRDLPEGRRVPVDSKPPVPLWNHSLVPLLLFLLISCEWILRRRIEMNHSS
ncbi:MAG: hypothetical protein ACJZ8O_12910 [Pirellulaceae bacterium]